MSSEQPLGYEETCASLARKGDVAFFEAAARDLPVRLEPEPLHCGPHSVRSLADALHLAAPRQLLEIGMNLGHSASLILALTGCDVVSVELRDDARVRAAADTLRTKYPGRFAPILGKSSRDLAPADLWPFKPDTAFIDGAHDLENVRADIRLCVFLGCRRLLLDDWYPHWGDVRQAAIDEGLVPLAILGAMALCAPPGQLVRPFLVGERFYEGDTRDERNIETPPADGPVLPG